MGEDFINLLGPVSILNLISGVCIPGLPTKYKKYNKLAIAYCLIPQLVCLFQSACCVYVIADYKNAKNLVHVFSILILYLGSLFWSSFLLIKRDQLHHIINRINIIIEIFNKECSNSEKSFKDYLKIKFISTKNIIIGIFISFLILPIANNSQKMIRNWKFFGLDGIKTFNYQSAYDASYSPVYEITILLQGISLFWTCTAQGCCLYLFSTFYYILSIFFKQLQNTINNTLLWHNILTQKRRKIPDSTYTNLNENLEGTSAKETASNSTVLPDNYEIIIDKKYLDLKQWVSIHQEILSIGKDVIDMYSPLLSVYFIYIYTSIAFTVFSALQNAHAHTLVELMVLSYFSLLTLINFYMLCSYGHYIKVESENVAWHAYAAPWYNSNYQLKSLIKIIILRAAKPLIVNCYSSTSFDLTNATFIVMMKSIVSFYFGLVQMKKQ